MLGVLVILGALLSKPRMSYYAVDLMSSLPSGGGGAVETSPSPEAIKPAPKVTIPKIKTPAPRTVQEEDIPDNDTIKMLAKLKKKRIAQQQAAEEYTPSKSAARDDGGQGQSEGASHGGGGMLGGGPGITAAAGTPFPYPWYLKAIADRLDKQWKPPPAYESDTTCQVTFDIDRAGQISGSKITQSSRDSLFDQLALRAVLYANPMPPLPNGFPEDSLKVHMKFVGKR